MEILEFFEPVNEERLHLSDDFEEASWYYALERYNGDKAALDNKKIALIGIEAPDDNGKASYDIRRYLYRLKRAEFAEEVVDLGNFKLNYQKRAYESLGFTLSELIAHGLLPVIINGSQEATIAQYLCFTYLRHYVNLAVIDSRLDFNLREGEELNRSNFLQHMLTREPSYLFSLIAIGYQSHFSDTVIVDFLEKLYFDLYRLGDVQADIAEMEPILRNAHLLSFDLSSIRQSDAPGTMQPSPNGFYAEQACMLARYAGVSSSLRSIGFYNYNPGLDINGQTAQLNAQLIWYFVDGYLNRYPESPSENQEDFLKFITTPNNGGFQMVFYKSRRTDRWWMEVPVGDEMNNAHIMPCSYTDYLAATRSEVPERWLQAVKKFS
jgi:arginase family enzyme